MRLSEGSTGVWSSDLIDAGGLARGKPGGDSPRRERGGGGNRILAEAPVQRDALVLARDRELERGQYLHQAIAEHPAEQYADKREKHALNEKDELEIGFREADGAEDRDIPPLVEDAVGDAGIDAEASHRPEERRGGIECVSTGR